LLSGPFSLVMTVLSGIPGPYTLPLFFVSFGLLYFYLFKSGYLGYFEFLLSFDLCAVALGSDPLIAGVYGLEGVVEFLEIEGLLLEGAREVFDEDIEQFSL